MAAFASADTVRPKDFHEVAWLRLAEVVEVATESELVKKARRSRAIRIPAAPNAFAVALISNDQLIERGEVELKLPALAQGFEGANENNVSGAGTKAREGRLWDAEKFAGLKMSG